MVKRNTPASDSAAGMVDLKANSSSRPKRSNVAYSAAKQTSKSTDAVAAASEKETVEPMELTVEPKGSSRRKQAVASASNGPTRKRPKLKLEEIQPDAPPSSQPDPILSVQPTRSSSRKVSVPTPDPASSEPIPDPATSFSNATVMKTNPEGRSIVHIDHRTSKVLGTYKSCFAAAKSVGISRHIIDSLVRGIYKANHHKGWTFRYATSEEEAAAVAKQSSIGDIEQIDVKTGNVIATFRSGLAASRETGVGRKDITSMLKGELESKNGWTFRLAKPVLPDVVKSEPPDPSVEQRSKTDVQSDSKESVKKVNKRASAKNVEPGNSESKQGSSKTAQSKSSVTPKSASTAKKVPDSKASKKASKKSKKTVPTDVSEDTDWPDDAVEDPGDDEPTDYEMVEITVTEHGSLGIMARKTKAPEAVLSLVHLFNGASDKEMNLRIDSFIGSDSIAEKFGMQVDDYLFLSYLNPECGSHEELIHGEYENVAFYIRRQPRPTTFYVVRSKSNVIPSKGRKSLSSEDDDALEDMDPMNGLKKNKSDYIYQPIVITEPGSLGMKVVKCKRLPKGADYIPYFHDVEDDSYLNYSYDYSIMVDSLRGKNSLARKFGIQAGDYLVLPSSEYPIAMHNYQEAFFLDTYEGVRDVIENEDRPITLYAIRLKSSPGTENDIEEVNDDDSEDDIDDVGSYQCSGYEGWQKTQAKVVAMAKDFRNWKNNKDSVYDHDLHMQVCQRGIDNFVKAYPPGWPNVERWENRLAKITREYNKLMKATNDEGDDKNEDDTDGDDDKEDGDGDDDEILSEDDDGDGDGDDDGDDDDSNEEEEEEKDESDDDDDDEDEDEESMESKVIAMELEFWKWKKGKNPSYDHKYHLKLCKRRIENYLSNHYPSGCDQADVWERRMTRMTKVYKKVTNATKQQ